MSFEGCIDDFLDITCGSIEFFLSQSELFEDLALLFISTQGTSFECFDRLSDLTIKC